jgi:hypothetical protein
MTGETMTKLLSLILIALPMAARADVFAFKDLEGYQKCLRTDHLVESDRTGTRTQTQYRGKLDVQVRCVEAAVALLAKEQNKDTLIRYVKATFAETAQANAIDLVALLAKADRPSCNEKMIYDVLLDIFSGPRSDAADSLYQRAKKVAKLCLSDKTFRQDFTEELNSTPGSYRADAACEILTEEKIVKSCPKKP